MDILYPCCAGLDVHKDTVVACVRRMRPGQHQQATQHTRTFGTRTPQLLALADWLAAEDVSQVAMESIGVCWRPVWNLLEGRFTVLLVNAQHLKQVPVRKTESRTAPGSRNCCSAGCCGAASFPRPSRGSCAS